MCIRDSFNTVERITIVQASPFQGCTDGVGTTPGGHDFLACDQECRTHGRGFFTASAATVALLEIAGERAVSRRECERWRERQFQLITGSQAKVCIDSEPSTGDYFSRVKKIMRIKRGLDVAHNT